MTIVELLNKALEEQSFSYVEEALFNLTGIKPESKKLTKKRVNKKKELANKTTDSDFVNNFVDDLSIHPELVEKNIKKVKKNYRPEYTESLIDVSCSKCGSKERVEKEEFYSLARLSEGSYLYTCPKCIKRNLSR